MTGTSAADAAFLVPSTVEAAVEALGDAGPGAVALAGGTSIGLLIGQGLLAPSALVWLGRIPELSVLQEEDERMSIGATVTLAALAADPRVRSAAPALADAAASVGNTRVRAVATIGGALAHADPAQDLPPMLLALDAQIQIAGPGGERTIPLDGFFTGFMETGLQPGELIVQVELPPPAGRATYLKFTPRSQDDYATVGVACRIDGARAVVGLAGVAWTPLRLTLPVDPEAAGSLAAAATDPADDLRGSAAYKRAMTAVWVRRSMAGLLA